MPYDLGHGLLLLGLFGRLSDIASIQEAFPNIAQDKLGQDLAYSAMLTKLPSGLLGIVLASLIAAYMSTISTHLNWGHLTLFTIFISS